jgi:hypothetical protein
MKTIFLTLFFFFNFLSFSQKLIIHVFEKQEMISFHRTSVDSVLMKPDLIYDVNSNYTKYIIDLGNETSTYFIDDVEISSLPIKFVNLGNGSLKINILEKSFDYGLIVNTNYGSENVIWFWFTDNSTTVKNITKFNIEKPS